MRKSTKNSKSSFDYSSLGDYEVGYCKPPRNRQFKKGVSGNPKGRPKGKVNLATALRNSLTAPAFIETHNGPQQVTRMEAAVDRLVRKAEGGDIYAIRLLSAMIHTVDTSLVNEGPTEIMAEADQEVMSRLFGRFLASSRER